MDAEDDGQLMLRYARGDIRAFEILYARHRRALYGYLVRQTHHADAANDLFQEVWIKVITSRERYEPRAQFRTFLFRIAHNCFIDHCRRSRTRTENPADEDWERRVAAPDLDRPDVRAERTQLQSRYRAALASLPAEQRDVFLLYEESGLTLEEIASISGVGVETAKSRLRYAVSKLRGALSAQHDRFDANVTPVEEPGV